MAKQIPLPFRNQSQHHPSHRQNQHKQLGVPQK
jgi:hypothetical protein